MSCGSPWVVAHSAGVDDDWRNSDGVNFLSLRGIPPGMLLNVMGVPLIRLERKLHASPEAAREARMALGELAAHVPAPDFDDLRLLVTELVTNSLRHGGLGAGDAIHLVVQIEPETLRAEVRDPGPGFDIPIPPETADLDAGWGLYLLGRIADRWGIQGGPSTCVWFEMDLSLSRGPEGGLDGDSLS